MTEQEVRQFFKGLWRKTQLRQVRIRTRDTVIQSMSQIRAVRYDATKVSGGTESDISKILIAAEAKEEENTKEIARLSLEIANEKSQALAMARCCDTAMQEAVVLDRWLNGYTWEKMERAHHYSRRQLERFEEAGMAAIARNYRKADSQNGNVPRRRKLAKADNQQEMSLFAESAE